MPSPLDEAQALLAARRPADAAALLEPHAATSDDPELHHLLGNALVALGRADEAERCYRRAVELEPLLRKSWNNLGNLAGARGDLAEALACYGRALALEPSAPAHFNRGRLLARLGRHDEALTDFEAGVRLDPGHAKLRAELGVALAKQHRWRDALPHLRVALARGEATTAVRSHAIDVVQKCGDDASAIELASRWVVDEPESALAHRSLGMALMDLQRERSIAHLRESTRLDPSNAGSWWGLAGALAKEGLIYEAEDAYKRSSVLHPHTATLCGLARIQSDLRRPDEAIALYDRALQEHSELSSTVESERLCELSYSAHASRTIFEEHVAWSRRHASSSMRSEGYPNRTHPRIRVAYLSPDFCNHVVAFFLEPILSAHDRDRFEIFVYADNALDEVSARLGRLVDCVRHVQGMTDNELAEILSTDALDVLVDLAGHTVGNRQELLASRRFATLTATFLGYPNTTGNPGIDVRIGDSVADGAEENPISLCTERLWSLASPAWRYSPPAGAPDLGPDRSSAAITFGSFNNFRKLSPAVLALWARVLGAVPESRLLVKARPLADATVVSRFRAELVEHGIDPERLDLRGWRPSTYEYLAVYNEVDVALDSFPYHGTTTTCEALWMGVPVVSLAGDAHVSRVGLALLSAVGHPEWCASTPDEYVARAVELARHRPNRQAVRAAMQSSPLLDPVPLVRELEGRIVAWLAARGRTIDATALQAASHSR